MDVGGVDVWELEATAPGIVNPILLNPKCPNEVDNEGCPRWEGFLSTIPPPELFVHEVVHCILRPKTNKKKLLKFYFLQ